MVRKRINNEKKKERKKRKEKEKEERSREEAITTLNCLVVLLIFGPGVGEW